MNKHKSRTEHKLNCPYSVFLCAYGFVLHVNMPIYAFCLANNVFISKILMACIFVLFAVKLVTGPTLCNISIYTRMRRVVSQLYYCWLYIWPKGELFLGHLWKCVNPKLHCSRTFFWGVGFP